MEVIEGKEVDKIIDKAQKNINNWKYSMAGYLVSNKSLYEIIIGENAKLHIGAFCDWHISSKGIENYYHYNLKPNRRQKRRMKDVYNKISNQDSKIKDNKKKSILNKLLNNE
jgi:hypothetical protein